MASKACLAIVVAAAVTVSACSDRPKLWKRSEIENIAEDFADAYATTGQSQVGDNSESTSDLKVRVRQVEAELAALKTTLAETNRAFDAQSKNSQLLQSRSDSNDLRLTNAVNALGRYHGVPPIDYVPQPTDQ